MLTGKSFPKSAACIHHPFRTLGRVGMAFLCVCLGQHAEKVRLSPQTCKILTSFLDTDCSKAHAIGVNKGKAPFSFAIPVKENIAGRVVQMQNTYFMCVC